MKKFTFKGVLDGFRSNVQPQITRPEQEIQEQLRTDNFTLKRTFRHGFPHCPSAFAFDPVQRLLAIGDKSGCVQILGQPGVHTHLFHEGESACAIMHVEFLINEGAIVTVTADDTLHLWNIRNKTPRVVQSLKFQKERIRALHLPVGSKWLYVGTEKGNVHVVHIATFGLSGYIINWNKSIELIRTTHPGAVISLCDNPIDSNKLLIAFECGLLVLWDLREKYVDIRWQSVDPITSIAWHHEGRYFISSHSDGSICSWLSKSTPKPQTCTFPHGKPVQKGNAEKGTAIYKVDLKVNRLGETFTIFSGGLPPDKGLRSNSITVMIGKSITILEMEHNVIDFITLCENPWSSEIQEPYAIAVLLQNDLVVIDLLTPGFPCFETPYPMDLHESPVTYCTYLTDCPSDLVPAFYSVGRSTTAKKSGFSEKDWPISGGEWSPASCSYSEIVITGHQDGSIKFWDSGAGALQILYKLKTGKIFEKIKRTSSENAFDNPLAIEMVALCSQSRRLCVAGAQGHVMLFKFRKVETNSEILTLEIPILYENFDDFYGISPENELILHQATESSEFEKMENILKIKIGTQRKPPGFQSQLVCFTTSPNRRNVQITSLCMNSFYGLMAYGTEYGLVIVDIIQKVCLLSVASPDLYGAQDPYYRIPKSPKRNDNKEDQSRSPSSDQLNDIVSPETKSTDFIPDTTPSHQTSSLFEHIGENRVVNSHKGQDVIISARYARDRKKSVSWRTFNLKRQFSKANMKKGLTAETESIILKENPDIICTDGEHDNYSEDVNNSWVEDSNIELRCKKDISDKKCYEDVNFLKESCDSNKSQIKATLNECSRICPDTAESSLHICTKDKNYSKNTSDIQLRKKEMIEQEQVKDVLAIRPTYLSLLVTDSETENIPAKPVRHKLRDKREQRLRSVPNIKYHMRNTRIRPFTIDSSPSFISNLSKEKNKIDGSFSRSRSSSMSSIDISSSESVTCLAIIESVSRRNDIPLILPTLWIGTSFGSILTVLITMPDKDVRKSQPVLVTINGGPIIRLKGSITSLSFLNGLGFVFPCSFELWKDVSDCKEGNKERTPSKSISRSSPTFTTSTTISGQSVGLGSRISGENSTALDTLSERQYVVVVSEKQTNVFDVTSQTFVNKINITDVDFVVKAETVSMKDGSCLAAYLSNGHVIVYSLPSLRLLLHAEFLPLMDLSFQTKCKQGIVDPMLSIWGQQLIVNEDTNQISKIFCFSNKGHGLYLASPTEIQKFSISSEFCHFLPEMMAELFIPHVMPEQPKEGFLKGLFGGGAKNLNREELFGVQSGKSNRSVAKYIPGANINQLGQRTSSASSEITRAHQLVLERGEKLNMLEEKAERMANQAQDFSGTAHQLMLKYKDKKWYQL